jgi:methionyl-tRNA formyltransferase
MLKRHGILRTANKLLYNWYRSRFLAAEESATISRAFSSQGYLKPVPTIEVPNINDPACRSMIAERSPDLIAVCGTSVIRPEIFSLAPLGAINIHTGITPEYRSAEPIFWALYHGQPDKVGVTIHYVDAGIDTGKVIYQEQIPVCSTDTIATVYIKCIQRGAQLYLKALDDAASSGIRTMDQSNAKGRAFYSMDLGIIEYLVFLWRFGKLRRRLPLSGTRPTTEAES